MKYAVVITYSFNGDVPVYLFDNYDKAKEYLHDFWQDGYNAELAESTIGVDEEKTYHEDDYAIITWNDGDYMEYILTFVSEPVKIDGKDYR